MHACIHASKDACMHASRQTDNQAGRQADSHTYIRMYVRTYMHTSMHSCIHPSMHTYMVLLTPPLDWSPRSATFAGFPACARSLWSVEGRRSFHQLERKLGAWLWCIKQQTCDDFIGLNPKKHLVVYFMDLTKNKCDFIGFNEVGKNTVFGDFSTFSYALIFFLFWLSLSLTSFTTPSVHVVGSLTWTTSLDYPLKWSPFLMVPIKSPFLLRSIHPHLATARRRPRCLGRRLWRLARAAKLAALLARMGSLVELGDFSDFQQEKWRFHQGNVWYSLRYQEIGSILLFLYIFIEWNWGFLWEKWRFPSFFVGFHLRNLGGFRGLANRIYVSTSKLCSFATNTFWRKLYFSQNRFVKNTCL